MLRLLRRRPKTDHENRSLVNPAAWLQAIFGVLPSIAGPAVTATSAMKCAAVRCAVLAISETLAQLPVHVYRRTAGDARERAQDHPIYQLLHGAVNTFTPTFDFIQAMVQDALTRDAGGIAYVNRTSSGRVVELLRFQPGAVTVELDQEDGGPVYRHNGSTREILPRDRVLHIASPGCVSPVTDGREAIGLAMVMEAAASRLWKNGGRPSGVLSFDDKLGAEVAARIKASWQAAHGGENSGGTAVLEQGGKYVAVSMNSTDAQFHEMRGFAISEVARVFRIPTIMLQDYQRATWANSEEQGRQFLTYCLMPWIKRIEGQFAIKLFTPEERSEYYAAFLIDDLTRADIAKRAEAYNKLIASRVLNPNEVRAMENRGPYPGGDVFENPNTTTTKPASKSDVE